MPLVNLWQAFIWNTNVMQEEESDRWFKLNV